MMKKVKSKMFHLPSHLRSIALITGIVQDVVMCKRMWSSMVFEVVCTIVPVYFWHGYNKNHVAIAFLRTMQSDVKEAMVHLLCNCLITGYVHVQGVMVCKRRWSFMVYYLRLNILERVPYVPPSHMFTWNILLFYFGLFS